MTCRTRNGQIYTVMQDYTTSALAGNFLQLDLVAKLESWFTFLYYIVHTAEPKTVNDSFISLKICTTYNIELNDLTISFAAELFAIYVIFIPCSLLS
jgi:hypothetical protein